MLVIEKMGVSSQCYYTGKPYVADISQEISDQLLSGEGLVRA